MYPEVATDYSSKVPGLVPTNEGPPALAFRWHEHPSRAISCRDWKR